MGVYVLTFSWQFDFGDHGVNVELFSNINKAVDRMKEKIKEANEYMKDFDCIVDEDFLCYSIYENENYAFNHIDITVSFREVK